MIAEEKVLVVVLGPGKENEAGWRKRLQIRDSLGSIPGVKAHFPEDPELRSLATEQFGVSGERDDFERELIQCAVADLVVALETSDGVKDEVAIFSRIRSIAPKVVTFLPERFRSTTDTTFPGKVRSTVTREYFSDREMAECTLASNRFPAVVHAERVRRVFGL